MKEIIRYGLILALICTVASAALATVNYLTKSRIVAQARAEEETSLKEVITEALNFEPVKSGNDILYHKAYDKDGKFIGVAFKAKAQGYSSTIETMVGMTKAGQILAIKILSQNDTPGLGSQVAEPGFTGRFSNKNIEALDEVGAITGATISSSAVIDSVKEKAKEIQELLKNEK
jgi:electron transport complex protein RnfG